jgi:FkbM family methyltransferase
VQQSEPEIAVASGPTEGPSVEEQSLESFLRLAGRVARQGYALGVGEVVGSFNASTAQFRQDLFCLLFSDAKREGFFVEFGACDGVTISNTLLLERQFGWTGILAEPGRHWHTDLRKNRSCAVDTRCVWNQSGVKIQFNQTTFNDRSTAAILHGPASGEVVSSYDVEAVLLADLLADHKAPRYIDFLSVDVEGAEFGVLEAFPFDAYQFGFICVEQHGEEQAALLASVLNPAGYRQILAPISGYDGWYVPVETAVRLDLI